MFTFHTEFKNLPYNQNDFHSMITLCPDSVIDKKIPPKSILYLLDVSGSVEPKLAKQSIVRSLPFLRSEDEICVISYSTETSIDVPWTKCTPVNKEKLVDSVKSISTGGWSNMSNGIFHAIEQCTDRDANIVILSDGETNSGITNSERLVNMVKTTLEGTQTRIHAFALSSLSDSMRDLTVACNGTYNYISSYEELPVAYGSVLGAVLSTVYQGVSIHLKSDSLMFTDMNNTTITSHYVGDIYAQEKKDILFKCHVIQSKQTHVIQYTIKGSNIISENPLLINGETTIECGDDNDISSPVLDRIEELRVVRELKRARTSSSMEKAIQILSQTHTPLKSLQEDLDMLIGSRDHEFKMRSLLSRIEQEYSEQRDNRSDDLLSDYSTPFRLWTSRAVSHD